MPKPSSRPLKLFKSGQRGFSLVEMGIAMAIFVILGVSVANLLTTATLTQVNNQVQTMCEHVSSNIMDRLRWDLRFATSANVSPDGSTLSVTQDGVAGNITYQFINNGLVRQDQAGRVFNFATAFYNDPNHPLRIFCQGQCFTQTALGNVASAQITVNNLIVRDNSPVGTALDNAANFTQNGQDFSRAQFRIEAATFNVLAGQQFQ
jgi:prepilin-type N-terminal cleavage/methylation domain-containing protein